LFDGGAPTGLHIVRVQRCGGHVSGRSKHLLELTGVDAPDCRRCL
jgi:hypothetical protein